MNIWTGVILISVVVIPAIICLGLVIHLLYVQARNHKLGARITKELNQINGKILNWAYQNHTLNANERVPIKSAERVVPRLLEFYSRKDLSFYFEEVCKFGTDEDVIRGMEFLEEETTAYYLQHEKVISPAKMVEKYFKSCNKRALNDDVTGTDSAGEL